MQADFTYQPVLDSAGRQLAVTILADRPHIRAEIRDDAEAAGFRITHCCSFDEFAETGIASLGDLVMVDCADASGAAMALLSRLDMRVGKTGANLVVSTTMAGLDAVFGCFALSAPQILVDPCRSERVIAIGRVLARVSDLHLREMGEDDRLMLLRLTEQVAQIAERIESISLTGGKDSAESAFRFSSPSIGYRDESATRELLRKPRPPLPDSRLVRQIIRHRQARARHFDAKLFADPAWDILLDLTAARAEHRRVSVTSLCIASGVAATTALRWIGQMVDCTLLERVEDEADRRRAFIALSDKAADAMARYFVEMAEESVAAI